MTLEVDRATKKMAIMAVRMANRRMRSEILPSLQGPFPSQLRRSWNPLTLGPISPDTKSSTRITMKLRIADELVKQILRSSDLNDAVDQIIEDSIANAVVDNLTVEHTPYLATAIRNLFND